MEQKQPTRRQHARLAAARALRVPGLAARYLGKVAIAGVRWAADQVPEVLLLGGAAAMSYGAWQVYRPAGWIAGGLLMLAAGWRLGRPTQDQVKSG